MTYIYRQLRGSDPPDDETARGIIEKLFFSDKRYNLGEVGRFKINRKLGLNFDENTLVLTKEDIISIVRYIVSLVNNKAEDRQYRPPFQPPRAVGRRTTTLSLAWVWPVWRAPSANV